MDYNTNENGLSKIINIRYKLKCFRCGGEFKSTEKAKYYCDECNKGYEDEFEIIKDYLKENGPTESVKLTKELGMPISLITRFLRQGMVEVSSNSVNYIKCLGCGIEIRYGSYCPDCARIAEAISKENGVKVSVGEVVTRKPGSFTADSKGKK